MANLKITLFGIGGVYNYGCEAIVRGTELIIKKKYPDAQITYMSYRLADDIKRLNGTSINIKAHSKLKHSFLKRCINRLRRDLNISLDKRLLSISLDWADECDIVLSIGGDVYNLLSTEKYQQKKYWNERIAIGKKIKDKGKKMIIWGASTGPFEENLAGKDAFINHFKNDIEMITVRETNTEKYLLNNGVLNFRLFSDPAFAIDSPTKNVFNKKPVIGINLSPLSIKYCITDTDKDSVITKQAKLIEGIIKKYDANIILIPHVVSDFNIGDDDLRYLMEVYNRISQQYKDRVNVIKNDPGFIGLKEELVKCDIVLAARMHCAINAISCAIPTVFIGYSDKASGMCKYVYGDLKYYITLNQFNEDASIVDELLDNKEEVNEYLKKRIVELKQKAYESAEIFIC